MSGAPKFAEERASRARASFSISATSLWKSLQFRISYLLPGHHVNRRVNAIILLEIRDIRRVCSVLQNCVVKLHLERVHLHKGINTSFFQTSKQLLVSKI